MSSLIQDLQAIPEWTVHYHDAERQIALVIRESMPDPMMLIREKSYDGSWASYAPGKEAWVLVLVSEYRGEDLFNELCVSTAADCERLVVQELVAWGLKEA